ncbi:hypothetical protein SESBI_36189 [Sesbania bispinosa]|nr:hypothetical protein SESBI_36189 [Sesbania bispinosa]
MDQLQEPFHGDWMVVNRTKKNKQNRGKSQAMPKDQSQENSNKGKFPHAKGKDQTQENNNKGKFPQAKGKETILGSSSQKEGGIIFSSLAPSSPSKQLIRKKRHRVDNSFKSSPTVPNDLPNPKQFSATPTKSLPSVGKQPSKTDGIPPFFSHNIKTAMNVDILVPNRLRFKDAEEPPVNNGPEQFENALDHYMDNDSDGDGQVDASPIETRSLGYHG